MTSTSRRSSKVLTAPFIAVAVAMLGITAGASWALGEVARDDVEEEPAGMGVVSAKQEVARGTSTQGRSWRAVRYRVARGDTCLDVEVAVDGRLQSVGGCFKDGAPDSQLGSIDLRGDRFAVGRLEGPAGGTGTERALSLEFVDGTVQTVQTAPDGVFVLPVRQIPDVVQYVATSGQVWRHAYGDMRPG